MSLLSVGVLILLANILDFGAIEKLKDLETCIHIPHPGNTILGLPRFCIVRNLPWMLVALSASNLFDFSEMLR